MNKLKDFKNCDKGHFYPKDADVCPYCPKGSVDTGKTIKTPNPTDLPTEKKTGDGNPDPNSTIVFGSGEKKNDPKSSNGTKKFDPNRTVITPDTVISNQSPTDNSANKTVKRRKLRGWLVTFDLKDMEYGVDFKIEEGRNTIGKKSSSDITIDDNEVSSDHAMILCRRDKFMLTDKLSSNGTFLNGEDCIPDTVYHLKDSDEIKVGHTTLLFKQAFK